MGGDIDGDERDRQGLGVHGHDCRSDAPVRAEAA